MSQRRGYAQEKDELRNRLRRIQGQIGGIERMIDEDRYCIDVVTQISAVEAALDQVAVRLLAEHTRHCVLASKEDERDARTEELIDVVGRLVRARR